MPTYTRPSAILAELRSTAPLRRASRSGRCQPRTEHATKPLTSSATPPGGSFPRLLTMGSPSPGIVRSASAAASSKDDDFVEPGRLPSSRAPSPGHPALARTTLGINRCRPVSLLACSWLSPLRSGSSAASPAEPPVRESGPARPQSHAAYGDAPSGPSAARRLLQPKQPASTTTESTDPRSRHLADMRLRAPPAPVTRSLRSPRQPAHVRLAPVERLLPGWGLRFDARYWVAVVPHPPAHSGISRPQVHEGERHDRQPRFHGPGATRLSPQAPLAATADFRRHQGARSPFTARPKTKMNANARELRPNPIRSGTSCHGIAAPPDGESGVVITTPPPRSAP